VSRRYAGGRKGREAASARRRAGISSENSENSINISWMDSTTHTRMTSWIVRGKTSITHTHHTHAKASLHHFDRISVRPTNVPANSYAFLAHSYAAAAFS